MEQKTIIKVEDLIWMQMAYDLIHTKVMLSPFKSDWCKVFEDIIQSEEKTGYLSSIYNYVVSSTNLSKVKNDFLDGMLKSMKDGNNDDLVIKIYTCNGNDRLIVTKFTRILHVCK